MRQLKPFRLARSIHSATVERGNMISYCSQEFVQTGDIITSSNNICSNGFVKYSTTPYDNSQKSAQVETYSFVRASSLQPKLKDWQQKREDKLTASTFSGAIGFWPRRRRQLWLEKIGAIEPFFGNLATCWNNIYEEKALSRYEHITQKKVVQPKFQVYRSSNSEYDNWLAASPDGLAEKYFDDLPSLGVLEIKIPFFQGDMSMVYPWKRIPIYYIPQAQGLMEILDKEWMDFYVWTVNGSSLFRLYRDREYWDVMAIALADFWWNNVQPAREMYKRSFIKNTDLELRDFRPEPKHKLFQSIINHTRRVIDNKSRLIGCFASERLVE